MGRKWAIPIAKIRWMIMLALVLILFANLAVWVAEFWSYAAGFLWGVLAAAAAYYCRVRAAKGLTVGRIYYLWLLVPVILTLVPIVLRVRHALVGADRGGWQRLWDLTPVLVGFVLPVALLLLAYSALRGHLPARDPENDPTG